MWVSVRVACVICDEVGGQLIDPDVGVVDDEEEEEEDGGFIHIRISSGVTCWSRYLKFQNY